MRAYHHTGVHAAENAEEQIADDIQGAKHSESGFVLDFHVVSSVDIIRSLMRRFGESKAIRLLK